MFDVSNYRNVYIVYVIVVHVLVNTATASKLFILCGVHDHIISCHSYP